MRKHAGSSQIRKEAVFTGVTMKEGANLAMSEASSDPLLSNYGGGISTYNRARHSQNYPAELTLPVPVG